MCLVDINRSTLSCNHSWYHLIQACTPTTSLESCSKLAVEGWVRCYLFVLGIGDANNVRKLSVISAHSVQDGH